MKTPSARSQVRHYSKKVRLSRARAPTWSHMQKTIIAEQEEKEELALTLSCVRAELAASIAAFAVRDKECKKLTDEREHTLCFYERQRGCMETELVAWKAAFYRERNELDDKIDAHSTSLRYIATMEADRVALAAHQVSLTESYNKIAMALGVP